MSLTDVNWIAVVVAAVVAFAVGWIWYAPLFGKPWSEAMGFGEMTPERQKAMQQEAMPGYVLSLLGALITAWALAVLLGALGVATVTGAVGLTLLLWLAFTLAPTITSLFFAGPKSPPRILYYIDSGHRLAYMVAMALVLALWP